MRVTLLLIGHTSMALGFVGIFVPLLPTTPFVLLAAVCYSRSSERFNTWIHEHERFGPMIHAWREHRAISVRAKIAAALMVLASITYSFLGLSSPWNAVALLTGAAVLTFILSRPSVPLETVAPVSECQHRD
jgi:uncharacterized membrane protein YbaN (DUF454 family)